MWRIGLDTVTRPLSRDTGFTGVVAFFTLVVFSAQLPGFSAQLQGQEITQRSVAPVMPDQDAVAALFQAKEFAGEGGAILKYRLLSPQPDTNTGATPFPLVLFLHGAGERGDDNRRQLVHAAADFARADRRQQYPAYVVFPQCPKDKKWVDVAWEGETGKGTFSDSPSETMRLTLRLLETLIGELPNVDKKRIYVTGLSMGGYGTWFASAFQNDRFAAAAPICGGGDPEWANRYSGIPLWAFHGGGDTVVPPSRSREMIVALTNAGHAPELRYTEYPGVGHNSWTQTYRSDEFFRWLFSQRRP